MTILGTISEIWRYPVKSMRGEQVTEAELRWTGLAGDRQFAFVRTTDQSRFPWLTGRVFSELLLYRAVLDPATDPKTATAIVTAPNGVVYEFWDPTLTQLLSDSAREAVNPIRIGRGAFDQHPVSIISRQTLHRLEDAVSDNVDARRFRINIIIEQASDAPPEDQWVGGTLRFGLDGTGPAIRVDEPAQRCVMVTIDPETAVRNPRIMRVVAQDFANQVGLYCAPVGLGRIAVGDPVRLER